MSKSRSKLNGSVESLAASLRDVISEAVEKGNESMMGEMAAMEGRINERIDTLNERIDTLNKRIDTTDQNMSNQFAAQAQYISDEIDKKLSKQPEAS